MPQEGVKDEEGRATPSILVGLTPKDRNVALNCEMGGGIQRGMTSEATPGVHQHLRVPDEGTVPRSLALDVVWRRPRPGVFRRTCSATSGSRRVQWHPCPGVMCSCMVRMEKSRQFTSCWTPLMVLAKPAGQQMVRDILVTADGPLWANNGCTLTKPLQRLPPKGPQAGEKPPPRHGLAWPEGNSL